MSPVSRANKHIASPGEKWLLLLLGWTFMGHRGEQPLPAARTAVPLVGLKPIPFDYHMPSVLSSPFPGSPKRQIGPTALSGEIHRSCKVSCCDHGKPQRPLPLHHACMHAHTLLLMRYFDHYYHLCQVSGRRYICCI